MVTLFHSHVVQKTVLKKLLNFNNIQAKFTLSISNS